MKQQAHNRLRTEFSQLWAWWLCDKLTVQRRTIERLGALYNWQFRYSRTCTILVFTFWKARRPSNFAQVGTEYTYSQTDTCMHSTPEKSKLQHTGTWSGTAWPPGRLCYRPAVFFQCIRLIALSFPQQKFKNSVSSIHYFLFKKCQVWNRRIRGVSVKHTMQSLHLLQRQ
jgi:hypothetical protein